MPHDQLTTAQILRHRLGKKSTERFSWAHFHRSEKQELDAAQLVLAGLPADWLQGDRIGPVTQTPAPMFAHITQTSTDPAKESDSAPAHDSDSDKDTADTDEDGLDDATPTQPRHTKRPASSPRASRATRRRTDKSTRARGGNLSRSARRTRSHK